MERAGPAPSIPSALGWLCPRKGSSTRQGLCLDDLLPRPKRALCHCPAPARSLTPPRSHPQWSHPPTCHQPPRPAPLLRPAGPRNPALAAPPHLLLRDGRLSPRPSCPLPLPPPAQCPAQPPPETRPAPQLLLPLSSPFPHILWPQSVPPATLSCRPPPLGLPQLCPLAPSCPPSTAHLAPRRVSLGGRGPDYSQAWKGTFTPLLTSEKCPGRSRCSVNSNTPVSEWTEAPE